MRAALAIARGAWQDAVARRSAFVTQVATMLANDLMLVVFWSIFFHQVSTVRGWDASQVFTLLAVFAVAAGLVLGLFANCRRIPELVTNGELDEALTRPVDPLSYLLIRRIDAVNLGDVVFGLVLFALTGHPTPARILLFAAGVLIGAVLLAAYLVAAGSLIFFTGRGEPASLATNAILLLAFYPADLFTGTAKALLYTVVPAAFVAAVPAHLIDRPDPLQALWLILTAGFFVALAKIVFTLGLRRHSSGSAWTSS